MIDQVLRLSFGIIARGIVWIRPALPAVCFVFLWSTIVLTVWNSVKGMRRGIANIKRMHQVPCANCTYATDSHHLKCSVHPFVAFSEEAIGCQDFAPAEQTQPVDLGYRTL